MRNIGIKLLLIFFVFSAAFFSLNFQVQAEGCLTRTVTFNADSSWTGGTIHVHCYGDSNPLPVSQGGHDCYGGDADLAPGQSAELDNCSCNVPPGDATDGCLHITSTPDSCNASVDGGDGSTCGVNGEHIVSNITGSCNVPQQQPPEQTGTPPPGPTCDVGTECKGPEVCCGTDILCMQCNSGTVTNGVCDTQQFRTRQCDSGQICNPSTNQCETPPPNSTPPPQNNQPTPPAAQITPPASNPPPGNTTAPPNTTTGGTPPIVHTPPPGPTCGTTCSRDSECAGARNGCNVCLNGTCQTPPTCGTSCTQDSECAKATNGCNSCVNNKCQTPPACGSACTQASDCAKAPNGCNFCTDNKCSSFNPNMCKCDGLTSDPIFPGEKVNITAHGFVNGPDTAKAKLTNFSFFFGKGDNTSATVIAHATVPATVLTTTSAKTEYQGVWTVTIPADIDPNAVYRFWSVVNTTNECKPQTGVVSINTVTEATPTPQPVPKQQNILDTIVSFFKGLFGIKSPQTNSQPAHSVSLNTVTATPTTYSPVPTNQSAQVVQTQTTGQTTNNQLQLKAIYPAKVLSTGCDIMRFQFTGTP